MGRSRALPRILTGISLDYLVRVDAALEGDWNATVVTVWTRADGLVGFESVTTSHPTFKPSLEIYFEDGWLGIHCYDRVDERNVFDEQMARHLIHHIEARLPS
jgi:hypothetical protein